MPIVRVNLIISISLLYNIVDRQTRLGFRGKFAGVAFRGFRNASRSIARAIGDTKFADTA